MAYSDTDRRRVQPKELGAAIAINMLAILGIASMTPQGQKLVRDPPIIMDFFPPEQKAPPPPDIPTTPPDTNVTTAPRPNDGAGPLSTTILSPSLPDPGIVLRPLDPVPDPGPTILPHNPILKGARPDPRYAATLQPEYPPSMIRAEIEGAVSVRVLVGIDGRVKDVQVTSSADEAFSEATKRQALRKWRFLPATRDGEPFEAWRDMTVRFTMPD